MDPIVEKINPEASKITAEPAKDDISRRTIVVLLLLVTILSALGAFAVLAQINIAANNINPKQIAGAAFDKSRAQAKVTLTVNSPEPDNKSISTATAKVIFTVKPPENKK